MCSGNYADIFFREMGLTPLPQGAGASCWLTEQSGALVLKTGVEGNALDTVVNFADPALLYRLETSGKRQGIGQAVGLNKHPELKVVDCTAGLGRDAFILAGLGCRVIMLERNPVVHALLKDGLERGRQSDNRQVSDICQRLHLSHAVAHDWLKEIQENEHPDVIYLDPMFPQRRKSAKVKKDMAGLQALLGPDEDVLSLIDTARYKALRRVVVKRPRHTSSIYPDPDFSFAGKAMQFDVFLPRSA